MADIRVELKERLAELKANGKLLEAQRLEQRTNYDLEMMEEMGYCTGIENYSRHMDNRKAGQAPFTLVNHGDRARKEMLVNYGFRLPSAIDNRPLTFEEFYERINQVIYVSATPADYELGEAAQVVEQIIRPTGLLDPHVEVRPIKGQIDDLMGEIRKTVERGERMLVTTLTKRMAEDLTD